jgi:hypothetical protein
MWVMTSVETLGYYHMSLRDNDLARFSGSALVADPSGIGGTVRVFENSQEGIRVVGQNHFGGAVRPPRSG